jgi:FixJ family two-component response regulator
MSEAPDVRACVRALRAGAADFLLKPLKDVEVSEAVETGLHRSREQLHFLNTRRAAKALLKQLTPREREVLGWVISGRINKEIAAELGASEKTIKKHRGQVMRKLKVDSVAELTRFALQHGVESAIPMGPRSHIHSRRGFLP